MRPRAIAALNALPDERFIPKISEGLGLIAEHALRLADAASCLASERHGRAMRAMEVIATEEAAKYLILLDAIRCPPPQARRAVQLKRFNSHLVKGIYAAAADTRPSDLAELLEWIEFLRRQYYLDGPNDVDWIFRNEVQRQREEALYVDYVETDEGHHWLAPHPVQDDPLISRMYVESSVLRLVRAMEVAGFRRESSLSVIAEEWRGFTPDPETRWVDLGSPIARTLQTMEREGLPESPAPASLQTIFDSWPFPLWGQDLSEIEVDPDELRGARDSWHPPW